MRPKSQLNHNKFVLILAEIGVLALSMVTIFWLMVLGNKERIESDLRASLDASTQAMAAQLKANQVPLSASSVEPGVLIINQTDGTVVIDHRNGGDAEQKLWEGYKTKIIYEMQKQKRGWIEYPDKSTWNLSTPKRIIRYVSIDELNWILALEDLQPSSLDLLKKSVNPATCYMIFFVFILGAVALWVMTLQYFDLIKRQISNLLENDLISLNGEEKLWGKSQGQILKMNEINKETGLEFSTPKAAALPEAPAAVEDPIMEEIFHKPSSVKPVNPIQDNIALTTKKTQKEAQKEIPKAPRARPVENNDMAVDVQHINSPVLKKILKRFREK